MTEIHWVIAVIIARKDEKDHLFEYEDLIKSFNNLDNEHIKYLLLEYYDDTQTCYIKTFTHKLNAFEEIGKFPFTNFYNGILIKTFLTDHVYQHSDLCKYMLITWGHGAGLGFFTREITKNIADPLPIEGSMKDEVIGWIKNLGEFSDLFNVLRAGNIINPDRKPNPKELFAHKFTGFLSTYSWLEENGYIPKYDLISSEKFGNILNECFGGKKIDILLTINCYMQTFESGYALRRNVNYLVSSQTGFLFAGIHYLELFKCLNKSKSISDISELIVIDNIKEYYKPKYDDFEIRQIENYSTATKGFCFNQYQISANKLSIYDGVKDILNAIVKHYYANDQLSTQPLPFIRGARRYCLDMTPNANYGIIDLLLFLQLYLEYNKSDTNMIKLISSLTQLLQPDTLIKVYRFDQLMDAGIPIEGEDYPPYYRKPQFTSVFFPNSKSISNEFIQQFMNDNYSDASTSSAVYIHELKWDDFIRAYYSILS